MVTVSVPILGSYGGVIRLKSFYIFRPSESWSCGCFIYCKILRFLKEKEDDPMDFKFSPKEENTYRIQTNCSY